MTNLSARNFLGKSVIDNSAKSTKVVGIIETILINTTDYQIDGFLVGKLGARRQQIYLPWHCVTNFTDQSVQISRRDIKQPSQSQRILGLAAWTTNPRFLVGFVFDFYFFNTTGTIESFVVHQLFRTWRVPATAIEKITHKALLIHNDTTVRLKMTPYPN